MIPWSPTGKTSGYCHVAPSGPQKHKSQERGSLSHKPHRVTSADTLDRRVTQSTCVQETQTVPSRGSWESHCENTVIDTPGAADWDHCLLKVTSGIIPVGHTGTYLGTREYWDWGQSQGRGFAKKLGVTTPLWVSWMACGSLTLSMSGTWVGIGVPLTKTNFCESVALTPVGLFCFYTLGDSLSLPSGSL